MDVFATFQEGLEAPGRFVVAFAWMSDGFLLARVAGRGWCTPSGHIEEGESALQAAVREVSEEAGAEYAMPVLLGCYRLRHASGAIDCVPAYLGEARPLAKSLTSREVEEVRRFTLDEIPASYYRWDPLLESVFRLAHRKAKSLFPNAQTRASGTPGSDSAREDRRF